MAKLLEAQKVGVQFGGINAVQNVSFSVTAGEIFGLLGPNGAGKTTLFNLISGTVRPTSGTVKFEQADITYRSALWRARHGIARTFQITRPFPNLSVLENVIVGGMGETRSMSLLRRRATEILDYVGLMEKRHKFADELSTGQRKRLELARALATEPRLLLMDEVTGGVDQPSIPSLVELVKTLNAGGMTIILIEHNMTIISQLCDRVLFMDQGAPIAQGSAKAVLQNAKVVELYLGEAL